MNRSSKVFINLCRDMESFLEIYFQYLQHEFKDQEQKAQPFATMILLMFFDSKTCIHSHSIVTVILFTFLNHSMGIYGKF